MTASVADSETERPIRNVVFISKATPGDDELCLWLAPRLEAAGYKVFADILSLEPGDRWRSIITSTLQKRAVKMLLCCSDTTLAAPGVVEEIEIATDLVKELEDPNFIIPLRKEPFKKLFGIGGLQYIDFVRGWAEGLDKLLEALKRQKVPYNAQAVEINPSWEVYRRRGAIELKEEPERLTSNWLRIAETPDDIHYFEPTGVVDRDALSNACEESRYPAAPMQKGIITFQSDAEFNKNFSLFGRFTLKHVVPLLTFVKEGLAAEQIAAQDASNVVHAMFRGAWERYCRDKGLVEYLYSKAVGFHAGKLQAPIGQKIPWGQQGERRSSMLRNVAKGYIWHFGVNATPAFWPFLHFKLKTRVLFAQASFDENEKPIDSAAPPIDEVKKQHRLRRSVCKGWRNKQWHGRLRAFIEMLSGREAAIVLTLATDANIRVEASAMLFSSPVSTVLPNAQADDEEEIDESTLGRPEPEEDE